jgi:hypothetical protein
MLKDELAKIDITDDTPFLNSGVILYCPDNNIFYRISCFKRFGFGSIIDNLCDGCDDYVDISMDTYTDEGFFHTDIDGGQFDFARKDYSGFINDEKLIRDCLKFVDCKKIDSCILIKKITP